MGLSVLISGAVIAIVLFSVLFAMPTVVDKLVSVSETSTQSTELDTEIIQTDIDLDSLIATAGLPSGSDTVNFTLNNDEQEKLWNFDDFDVIVKFDGVSGNTLTESLTYEGDCPLPGNHPTAGNWCIKSISGIQDPGIINGGESAIIVTKVSEDLANGNAIVSLNTDNGVIATLPSFKPTSVDVSSDPPVACEIGFYGRTFIDTDTGISYVCDPLRDKWLSPEMAALYGEENGGCSDGNDIGTDQNCGVTFGNNLGGDNPLSMGLYVPYDMTVVAWGFSDDDTGLPCGGGGTFDLEVWGSGSPLVDQPLTLANGVVIAAGLNDDAQNGINTNIDLDGNQYIIWGLDNDCNASITDWNMIFYTKWRHADP